MKEGFGLGFELHLTSPYKVLESSPSSKLSPLTFIKERLTRVYGISKNDRTNVKGLEDDLTHLRDDDLLYALIRSPASKAYDVRLLARIIKNALRSIPKSCLSC